MAKDILEDLEKAMTPLRKHMEWLGNVEILNKEFEKLKAIINLDALSFCVDKYLTAELDHETPGVKCAYRLSGNIPRMGGYFRKHIMDFSKVEYDEIYRLIKNLFLVGYLVFWLFSEGDMEEGKHSTNQEVHEAWRRIGRSRDFNVIQEHTGPLGWIAQISLGPGNPLKEIKYFLETHGMKGGGLFSKDKTDVILYSYLTDGYFLALAEHTI